MQPLLEHLPLSKDESFVVKNFDYKYYPNPWHFHPEYELVLVTESTGKRFIGDNISNFAPGNFAFIGPNLPHTYRNDDKYFNRHSKLRARSIVIHFTEASLGNDFLALPEARKLRDLFARSMRGIEITGKLNKQVSEKMHEILELEGLQRWMKLTDTLYTIASSRSFRYISQSFMQGHNQKESGRMSKIFDFVLNNYTRDIRVNEVAKIVNMADNSFSRYFSQRTRKTFNAFLTEIRLNHASKLLLENKMSVAEICFDSGFNNLSNFNRQFLKQYKMNPLAYRKNYEEEAIL
ncbi:MAG TPA: AraC family transcriptional regulator [Chitinophagaceae bacterium]|nr:AraC family transcriptional regulator [Chitinophagaceae bacterium]